MVLTIATTEIIFAGKHYKNQSVRRDLKKKGQDVNNSYYTNDYVHSVTRQDQDDYKKEDTHRNTRRGPTSDRIAENRN